MRIDLYHKYFIFSCWHGTDNVLKQISAEPKICRKPIKSYNKKGVYEIKDKGQFFDQKI